MKLKLAFSILLSLAFLGCNDSKDIHTYTTSIGTYDRVHPLNPDQILGQFVVRSYMENYAELMDRTSGAFAIGKNRLKNNNQIVTEVRRLGLGQNYVASPAKLDVTFYEYENRIFAEVKRKAFGPFSKTRYSLFEVMLADEKDRFHGTGLYFSELRFSPFHLESEETMEAYDIEKERDSGGHGSRSSREVLTLDNSRLTWARFLDRFAKGDSWFLDPYDNAADSSILNFRSYMADGDWEHLPSIAECEEKLSAYYPRSE